MSTFTKVYAALRQGVLPVADDLPDKIVGIQAGDLKTVFDELERLREDNARLQRENAPRQTDAKPEPPALEVAPDVPEAEEPGPGMGWSGDA